MSDNGSEQNTTTPTAPALPGAPADPAVEQRARRMGWVPKEQWRGDGGVQWMPADEFVRRSEESFPILRERNEKLDQRLSATENELRSTREQLASMSEVVTRQTQVLSEFREFASKGEERAYKRARREVEAKMENAVAAADVPAYKAAEAEMRELESDQPRPASPPPPPPPPPPASPPPPPPPAASPPPPAPGDQVVDPLVEKWVKENEWFVPGAPSFSPLLRGAAFEEEARILKEAPGMTVPERLNKVTENLKKQFPHKFGLEENPARTAPAAVVSSSAGGGPGRKKERGYDDLPGEAKAACDRFVATIPGFTKEAYLNQYTWDE